MWWSTNPAEIYRDAVLYGDNGLSDEMASGFEAWLRDVQAQAWDAGAEKASPYGGAYLRSLYASNPYREEN